MDVCQGGKWAHKDQASGCSLKTGLQIITEAKQVQRPSGERTESGESAWNRMPCSPGTAPIRRAAVRGRERRKGGKTEGVGTGPEKEQPRRREENLKCAIKLGGKCVSRKEESTTAERGGQNEAPGPGLPKC